MEREEKLEEIAKDFLRERYLEGAKKTAEYCLTHKEELMGQLARTLCEGAAECRDAAKKVKYVVFSTLESSILTQSYDLQIAFFDENIYLDENAVYVYWRPCFLRAQIDSDMQALYKRAAQTIIRIREYEIEQIRRKYVVNYYFAVFVLLKDMIPRILEKDKELLELMRDASFEFGRYMEGTMPIYQWGNEVEAWM